MDRRKTHIMQPDTSEFPYLCGRKSGDGYDYAYAVRQEKGLGLEPQAWCRRCVREMVRREKGE